MNTAVANVTEKSIAAFDARRQFGKVIDQVKQGTKFVVEMHGQPVAAVVPLQVYDQWKKNREAFFRQMRDISAQVNLSPEEADKLATDAVQAVRATKHV